MIDAREARLVYEENEYKNDIRDELLAKKKEEEKLSQLERALLNKKEFDKMTQTIWDNIATAAADGYNGIGLSVRDYNYGGPDLYVWDEHNWIQYTASINVRPYFDEEQFTGRSWRNQYEKRHYLTRIIEEYLKRHGYEVIEKNIYDSYYDADKIVIKW